MDSPLRIEDEHAVEFAPHVVEILNSTLKRDAKLSPADAALALNALYPDQRQGDELGERETGGAFLWWFWDLFHDLARQVPHDNPASERLAEVVKALRDLPPRTVDLDSWGEAQLWSELPLFGPTLREKWDCECGLLYYGGVNESLMLTNRDHKRNRGFPRRLMRNVASSTYRHMQPA